VHPLTEWTIPAFAFPAEAGTHLPTPEGWKAELALVVCYLCHCCLVINSVDRAVLQVSVVCGLHSCLVQENKDPEAVRRRAMQDPEIQQIIADPAMQLILQQMQKDPQALREYVSFPLSVCLSVLACLSSYIQVQWCS